MRKCCSSESKVAERQVGFGLSVEDDCLKTIFNALRCIFARERQSELEPVVLELDRNSRWFKVVATQTPTSEKPDNYEQVINFVLSASRKVKRDEIIFAFNGENGKPFVGTSTITDYLAKAGKQGRLANPRYGFYSAQEILKPKCLWQNELAGLQPELVISKQVTPLIKLFNTF